MQDQEVANPKHGRREYALTMSQNYASVYSTPWMASNMPRPGATFPLIYLSWVLLAVSIGWVGYSLHYFNKGSKHHHSDHFARALTISSRSIHQEIPRAMDSYSAVLSATDLLHATRFACCSFEMLATMCLAQAGVPHT